MNNKNLYDICGVSRSDVAFSLMLAVGTFCYFFVNVSSLPADLQFTKYSTAALQFLDGNLSSERIMDFSPLYLFLFVLVCKFSPAPVETMLLLQSVLVALSSGLLFLLLRRHFSMLPALAGSAAFVLSRSVMVYCRIFEPEVVLVFLLVVFLFLVELRGLLNAFIAGAILSLCLLTRPSFILLALCVPLYYYLRGGRDDFKLSVCLFILPVIAGFLSIVLLGKGSFPPTLMNPGTVIYDANNPLSEGVVATYPPIFAGMLMNYPGESDYQHAIYRLIARRTTGQNLSAAQVNRFWSTLAKNYIVDNPLKFARFELKKLYYLANSYRWHDIPEAYRVDETLQRRYLPSLPFALVAAFAILGFWAARGKYLDFFIPVAAVISQTLLMLVTYVSDRQRLSLLPFLIVFAVAGLSYRGKTRRKTVAAFSLTLVISVLFCWETKLVREQISSIENDRKSQNYQAIARSLQSEGKTAAAVKAHAQSRALAHDYDFIRLAYLPTGAEGLAGDALHEFDSVRGTDPVSRLDRAVLLIEAGKLEAAENLLLGLTAEINDRSEVPFQLGRIAMKRNMPREAERFFKEALAAAPGAPKILAQLAVLTGETRYTERLRRYFDEADMLYFLGLAHMEQHRYASAADCFKKLHRFVPDFWDGTVMLAAALSGAGNYREAADAYLSALAQFSDELIFPEKIIIAFRALAGDVKSDSYEQFLYGKVLCQAGDLIGARNVLRRSLQASGKKEVAEELRRVDEAIRGAGIF